MLFWLSLFACSFDLKLCSQAPTVMLSAADGGWVFEEKTVITVDALVVDDCTEPTSMGAVFQVEDEVFYTTMPDADGSMRFAFSLTPGAHTLQLTVTDADGLQTEVTQVLTVQDDADHDGYTEMDGDCDDTNADVSPAAVERCDGQDNNCNGVLGDGDADGDGVLVCDDCDDGDPTASLPTAWYWDGDHDRQGTQGGTPVVACAAPDSDYVDNNTDCDDTREDVYTGAIEQCDDVDNDCDGWVNEDYEDAHEEDDTFENAVLYPDLGHGNRTAIAGTLHEPADPDWIYWSQLDDATVIAMVTDLPQGGTYTLALYDTEAQVLAAETATGGAVTLTTDLSTEDGPYFLALSITSWPTQTLTRYGCMAYTLTVQAE